MKDGWQKIDNNDISDLMVFFPLWIIKHSNVK